MIVGFGHCPIPLVNWRIIQEIVGRTAVETIDSDFAGPDSWQLWRWSMEFVPLAYALVSKSQKLIRHPSWQSRGRSVFLGVAIRPS